MEQYDYQLVIADNINQFYLIVNTQLELGCKLSGGVAMKELTYREAAA